MANFKTETNEIRWERLPIETRKQKIAEVFEASHPTSVYNMVPDSMQKAMHMIDPKYMSWKESTLYKKCKPDERAERFRLELWQEYDRAKDRQQTQLSMKRVLEGTCTEYYYKQVILKTPKLLAWILTPPADYLVFMKEMLHLGQRRMRELMSVSPVSHVEGKNGEDGKDEVDMKLATLQIKAFALLDNRIKGAVTQRHVIEQKNLNVNIDGNQSGVHNVKLPPQTVDQIDKELKEIDHRLKQLPRGEVKIESDCSSAIPDVVVDATKKGRH